MNYRDKPTGVGAGEVAESRHVMRLDGEVVGLDRLGLGFIRYGVTTFPFTFDKLEGYRGQQPREFGLHEGCLVRFTVVDGSINSVKVSSSK